MIPVLKKRENTPGNRLVWWMREFELIDMTAAQHRVIARRINRVIREQGNRRVDGMLADLRIAPNRAADSSLLELCKTFAMGNESGDALPAWYTDVFRKRLLIAIKEAEGRP
jgi:hypothetical protein